MSVSGFIVRCALFGLLLVSPILVVAQIDKAQRLTEVELLRLQVLTEKTKRIQAEYNAAQSQCQVQPAVRSIINESEQVNAQLNTMVREYFVNHGIDPAKNKLNPENGEFSAIEDKK